MLTRLIQILSLVLALASTTAAAADETDATKPVTPFRYVQAVAFHIPPETTTEESGYFSLCEGRYGKIYVGTAITADYCVARYDPTSDKVTVDPLLVIMGLIVTHDGTVYATTIYPYTLMRIETVMAVR